MLRVRYLVPMDQKLPILDAGSGSHPGPASPTAKAKLQLLLDDLGQRVLDGALVAFSGGMDSAFLLWAADRARQGGAGRVMALTTTSPSTPSRDKEDARVFSQDLGIPHFWEESREMYLPEYARNDRDRCYHCKSELFKIAARIADTEKLKWLLYGYNASDESDDRPGHRAALEAGALTPLSDVGLTKAEISSLMKEAGLPLSGKPASPCLSSRIMTGIEITADRLGDVEEMEGILRRAGVRTLRVRVCRDEGGSFFLRVEVPPEEMVAVLECREELERKGKKRGYRWVTLDLGGYRTGGGVG